MKKWICCLLAAALVFSLAAISVTGILSSC